jgi:hypothetical protein
MLAFTEPADPADDDAYNGWYDDKHLHDVVNEELKSALTDGRADIHTSMDMTTLGAAFALPIGPRLESAGT